MRKIVSINICIFIGCFSGLILLESVFRVVLGNPGKSLKNDPNYYYDYEIYNKYFIKTTNSLSQKVYKSQRSRCDNEEFLVDKPKNVRRVFIIGESIANIFGQRSKEKLNKALNTQFPDHQYEIINCGTGGYESNRILLVFKEIVEYSPDLILLLMGNNISKEFLEMNQHLLNEYTRYFYENYWVCRKIFNLTRNKLKNNPKNIGGIYVFRVNYNEILEISKAKNIPLILFTVPANMKDYPPSSPSIPIDDKDFIIARLEMEENKYNSAIEIFTKLIKTEEYKANPYVYFYAAKCFENMSKYKKAKEMYYEAIDLDYGVRRHSRINEIIREIGRQKSYMFVDIEKIFTEFSENGLLGFDFFSDPCHWRSAYDELIIPEILKEVSRFSGKGPILNLNTDGFNREINRKAISEEASRAILYECNEGFYGVFNVFLSAEEGVPLKEAFVSKLRYIYPKCNKKLQAQVGLKDNIIEYLKLNIWQNNTEALNKNWNVVLWNIGEAFRQMKDYAPALEYFNASINTKSDDINAYYFRGMTYYMLKDYQKARNDWNIVINKDAKYSWLNDLVPLNDNKNIK